MPKAQCNYAFCNLKHCLATINGLFFLFSFPLSPVFPLLGLLKERYKKDQEKLDEEWRIAQQELEKENFKKHEVYVIFYLFIITIVNTKSLFYECLSNNDIISMRECIFKQIKK